MEIFVELYDGRSVKVFNTSIEKKKTLILTTVNDFQDEAEVKFFTEDKLLKKITFKDLPPARARVLDLPITLEYSNDNVLYISYKNKNEIMVENNIDLEKGFDWDWIKYALPILLACILVFLIGFLWIKFDVGNKLVSAIKYEELKIQKEEVKKEPPIEEVVEEKEIELSKYDKKSLITVINENTPIYFIKDKAVLRESEIKKIERILKYLKNYSEVKMLVEGHTESIGKPENEKYLSIKRAEYIKKLIENRFGKNRFDIITKGYGAVNLELINAPQDKKYLNRRTRIIVQSVVEKYK